MRQSISEGILEICLYEIYFLSVYFSYLPILAIILRLQVRYIIFFYSSDIVTTLMDWKIHLFSLNYRQPLSNIKEFNACFFFLESLIHNEGNDRSDAKSVCHLLPKATMIKFSDTAVALSHVTLSITMSSPLRAGRIM